MLRIQNNIQFHLNLTNHFCALVLITQIPTKLNSSDIISSSPDSANIGKMFHIETARLITDSIKKIQWFLGYRYKPTVKYRFRVL
jgi:hypothetical protein